jgi:hypothetical protein
MFTPVVSGPLGDLNRFVPKGFGATVAVLLLLPPPNMFVVVGAAGSGAKQIEKNLSE